jgi:hypothetical protein
MCPRGLLARDNHPLIKSSGAEQIPPEVLSIRVPVVVRDPGDEAAAHGVFRDDLRAHKVKMEPV